MPARVAEFSSAGLLALAAEVLAERDPHLVPAGFAAPDPHDAAHAPASTKAGLLEHALARGGPKPLLDIGLALHRLEPSPTLAALLASGEVTVLADKWNRFSRYHHVRNRAEIRVTGRRAEVRRYSTTGPPPGPAENVFVAGILFGLIRRLPVEVPVLEIGDWCGSAPDWQGDPPAAAAGRFSIRWSGDRPPASSPETNALDGDALAGLLAADIGRGWRLEAAARALAMSSRSLQRQLRQRGTSFSAELRRVRVAEAGRMLVRGDVGLAEIGYCCGYADQAHFQREFLRMTGVTPGNFRRIGAR